MAENSLATFNSTLKNERTQEYLKMVLGEKKASFVNNMTAIVSSDAKLQTCLPTTLLYAGIKATALDLPIDPNLGFAYLIPYKDNKTNTTSATFQMGYKGYIQLAMRSGQFKNINATDVREGEIEEYDLLSGEIKFRRAENRDSLPIIGFVAYFKLINGFEKMLYMTKEELIKHATKYSQTYRGAGKAYSKWTTDFEAMAQKTVLKLLISKYAPLSVEMQQAVRSDQAVLDENGNPHYVDNPQNEEKVEYTDFEEEIVVEKEKE